jgi:hypothetical protein
MDEYLGKVTLADLIQAQEGAGETETPVRRTK